MNTEKDITLALNNLIKGITMHSFKEQMRWHKVLYQIGKPAVPKIGSKLATFNASEMSRHLKLLYLSGLMRLIHDIDEEEAQKITQRLLQHGCDKMIANRLKAINEFTLNRYHRYKIKGVTVFEDKYLETSYPAHPLLEKWFDRVPDDDIREIDRIYVVSRHEQDYEGTYTPIFYNIQLVWDIPFSRLNPITWMMLILKEKTFYHEIGHHVHNHTFGQDLDQEREANHYAAKLIAKYHPIFYFLVKGLIRLIPQELKQELDRQCKYC